MCSLAAGGETILVSDRGRVVAELAPPRADAARQNWLTPSALKLEGPPPRLPVAPLAAVWRDLEDDRGAR